jgi:type I phosphodiesterase/nucleotide pyrophosphatase
VRTGRLIALGVVPLVLLLAAMHNLAPETADRRAGQERAFEPARRFRTVVFILDSAGKSDMFDPAIMPFVSSLPATSLSGRSRACAAKATFPCIKSIFEGREATMGTTLQDFSAFASNRTTWPASLAALGLRLVVASDHTLNRLYPHAFVDSINYEDLHVPLRERDAFVYRKARQWLDDPSIDVLVLHIIGTDKISHEYPVRGAEYLAKYREVDDFVREVAGRLQPEDYLFAISDHGHNELGGHTEDAAYVAHGPLFPADLHQDLNAEDLLFLLDLPYGVILPVDFDGQVRLDLTLTPPDMAERWLAAQAKSWGIPIDGLPLNEAQGRLNQEIVQRSTEGRHALALETAWRSAPFWLAAALFLIGELVAGKEPGKSRGRFRQIALLVSGLASFAAATFWLFPSGLRWIHDETHRPLAFIAFYLAAAGCGFGWNRARQVKAWRGASVDVLWIVALAIWLLSYFGPLGYSLTRHGSLMVLAIIPIAAVILAGGFRVLASPWALLLPGLLPVIYYDTESFNLKYPLLDRISQLPVVAQAGVCILVALLFSIAFPFEPSAKWRRRATALGSIAAWLVMGKILFQFEAAKLIGGLLACLWLASAFRLFHRAQLPLRWFALIGAVFLFVLLTFFLNGFALSHVDFRFATNKIYPFGKELWRAPQLILWAVLKYAFALLPALAIVRASARPGIWRQLLLLGWWRELGIVAGALGLAIFNRRGMGDLCSEEIYFWTFLNLVLFGAALLLARPAERSGAAK